MSTFTESRKVLEPVPVAHVCRPPITVASCHVGATRNRYTLVGSVKAVPGSVPAVVVATLEPGAADVTVVAVPAVVAAAVVATPVGVAGVVATGSRTALLPTRLRAIAKATAPRA